MPRLKLVPWEPTWLSHQTLDLHAYYRRPQRNRETYAIERDDDGFIQWNVTTALPIRSHVRFLQKGFEYITLATADDIRQAAAPSISLKGAVPLGAEGRPVNEHPDDYLRQPGIRGPWDLGAYLADQRDERIARRQRILENIEKYGRDGAEAFERERDPDYRLPDSFGPTPTLKRRPGRPRKVQRESVAV